MKKPFRVLVLTGFLLISPKGHTDTLYSQDRSRHALKQALPTLTSEQLTTFAQGKSLFDQMWVIAPSQNDNIDGLGPLYNSISCLQCHPGNGRGHAPDKPEQKLRSMLIRLSQIDDKGHVTTPHPRYGKQLQELAIPGVEPEGRAIIHYRQFTITLADGTDISMREPHVELTQPAYGEFTDTLTSARIGPALIGMGLIEAIADEDIIAATNLDNNSGDGISGRVHWIIDEDTGSKQVGRFGYKASISSLKAQITDAFHNDLGITSSHHPQQNCTTVQIACQQAVNGGEPELTDSQLDVVTAYLRWLAIPNPLPLNTEQLQRGQQLFTEARCVSCHRPSYTTRTQTKPVELADKTIWLYSDLLLHNMGPQLADNRPDQQATGQEWRTAPLWGIGLAETINPRANYLHDGRARTILEAILWHGGEAELSKNRVMSMPTTDREALLAFINTL